MGDAERKLECVREEKEAREGRREKEERKGVRKGKDGGRRKRRGEPGRVGKGSLFNDSLNLSSLRSL